MLSARAGSGASMIAMSAVVITLVESMSLLLIIGTKQRPYRPGATVNLQMMGYLRFTRDLAHHYFD
jgi:hypothetical protein